MNRPEYNDLLKAGLRRPLDPAEEAQLQAYFAQHPHEQAAWEEEAGLNSLLRQLPDVPVSSNFTSQVVRLIERQPQSSMLDEVLARWPWAVSWNWAKRISVPGAVFGIVLFSYWQYQVSYRAELARGAATVSIVVSAPPLEILENFDAIRRLDQVPVQVDKDLLMALQ